MDFHNDEDAKEQLSELTGQILADKHPVEWTVNPRRFSVHSTGCQKNEKEIKEMKRSRADKRSDDAIAIPKKDQY